MDCSLKNHIQPESAEASFNCCGLENDKSCKIQVAESCCQQQHLKTSLTWGGAMKKSKHTGLA
eukprot:c35245_g1_i1 orf=272-460(-)